MRPSTCEPGAMGPRETMSDPVEIVPEKSPLVKPPDEIIAGANCDAAENPRIIGKTTSPMLMIVQKTMMSTIPSCLARIHPQK